MLTELHLIDDALRRELPVFGICLGAQLIAKVLGAEVHRNSEKEIGWYDIAPTERGESDRLLLELRPTEKVFQWRGDTFDMPRSASRLAFSALCAKPSVMAAGALCRRSLVPYGGCCDSGHPIPTAEIYTAG